MLRFSLHVCGKSEVPSVAGSRWPTHVISLLDVGDHIDTPASVRLGGGQHLRLAVEDTCDPLHPERPTPDMVRRLLAFGAAVPDGGVLLVHCHGGISRSTAAAMAIAAAELGPGREAEAVALVRRARPQAMPNGLILALAGEALGTGGALAAAAGAGGGRRLAIPGDGQQGIWMPAPPQPAPRLVLPGRKGPR